MWIDSLFGSYINYGINQRLLVFSFVLMIPLAIYLAYRFNLSRLKFIVLTLISLYSSYFFARVFSLFLDGYSGLKLIMSNDLYFALHLLFHPFGGGIVFYGAMIGALIGMFPGYFLFNKKSDLFFKCFDITIICFAFTAIFSRIGDFGFGDAFGIPFDKFGLVFPPESGAAQQMVERGVLEPGFFTPPLFPTQIIAAAAKIIIFFTLLLRVMLRNLKVPLEFVSLFFVIYGPYRFLIDFVRFDRTAYFLGLTTAQSLSILFFIAGVLYYRYIYPKWKQNELKKISDKI